MKKTILLLFIGIFLLSCKKEKTSDTFLTAKVTELTPKTSITIIIIDQNQRKILEVVNKFGNTTYKSLPVESKDVLTIYTNSNVVSDLEGNGNGSVVISGAVNISIGGNLSYPNGMTNTLKVP